VNAFAQVTANDPDGCDTKTYSIIDMGGSAGSASISATGLITFMADPADVPGITLTIEVSDGELADTCTVDFVVTIGAPFGVRLEKLEDVTQGYYWEMPIWLDYADEFEGIGGFDLLIAYDASVLSFQKAYEGGIYAECGWEFFTYRYGPDGNCGSGCPSGILRVVGAAETNNGPYHPNCPLGFDTLPQTLAFLKFLVSNDRTLECQYVPMRFFWYDCGDNTLSNTDGSRLYVSQRVFDILGIDEFTEELTYQEIQMDGVGYPTFQGFQTDPDCEADKDSVYPGIDFFNGGFDIICADSIDARGDINVNGVAYEIADAVMFTNYFIKGVTAFGLTKQNHQDASIAASDANADGLPLSLADLVYLIRVVVGDALPYDKASPVEAGYSVNNGVLSVDGEMGAAFIRVSGNTAPRLMADNMEMLSAYDDVNDVTRILVYSMEAGQAFTGQFLSFEGDLVSIDLATYAGAPVVSTEVPTSYALEQNYPNPFNPTTTVAFTLKQAGEWKVTFYNVTGQVVDVLSGYDEAGSQSVVWDASDRASGIYFYKFEADDFTMTKKAILLK
jgi:hypothetical protein